MKKLLIIIPTFNAGKHILKCLNSIDESISVASSSEFKADVVVVDDCSADDTVAKLKQKGFENILIGTGNLWWSGSVNKGVMFAWDNNFDYIMLLNSDNIISRDFIASAYSLLKEKPDSIIGSVVLDQDQKPYFRGCNVNTWGQFTYINELRTTFTSCSIFGGMGVIIPVQVTKKIGLFDERNFPLYFGDTDYWLRCKKNNIESYICKDLTVFADLKNTGIKRSHKGSAYVLKNLFNIRFHANLKTVGKFYFKNYSFLKSLVAIFLFYIKGFRGVKS